MYAPPLPRVHIAARRPQRNRRRTKTLTAPLVCYRPAPRYDALITLCRRPAGIRHAPAFRRCYGLRLPRSMTRRNAAVDNAYTVVRVRRDGVYVGRHFLWWRIVATGLPWRSFHTRAATAATRLIYHTYLSLDVLCGRGGHTYRAHVRHARHFHLPPTYHGAPPTRA